MAVKLGSVVALKVAQSIARRLGVPLSELTKDMVRKAPVPVRYKKLFFGPSTKGETKIAPSIRSSRTVAKQEGKALGVGTGIGIAAGTAAEIMSAVKKELTSKQSTGGKGRNKPRTPVNRALDSAKRAVANPPKKKTTKPKPRPKKPIPRVRPKRRPGS
jgi:hypothetical protein